MPADFTAKQGDTAPTWEDTLTYSSGGAVNLEGATVKLVLRNLISSRPMVTTGELTVVDAKEGRIAYQPSAKDTAVAASLMGNWHVTFADATEMTFPTEGYLWISIEESLSTEGGAQLLGLPQIKDYLEIPADNRTKDNELLSILAGVQPLIENRVGPVVLTRFDEWYGGGRTEISLRHYPSFGYGTSPVLTLLGVSEYRGPIEYKLQIIGNPTEGSVYSCQLNAELGTVVRRTAGGGTEPFWDDPLHGEQTVHIVYEAGQRTVPANVEQATLEAIRVNFRTTRRTGRGRETVADEQELVQPLGFFLPRRCLELLSPTSLGPPFW